VVDYQLLKMDCSGGVGLVVGWCPSSSFILPLLDCCPLGCCVCFVFLLLGLENGERENMNGERNEGACAEQRDDPKWNEGTV